MLVDAFRSFADITAPTVAVGVACLFVVALAAIDIAGQRFGAVSVVVTDELFVEMANTIVADFANGTVAVIPTRR